MLTMTSFFSSAQSLEPESQRVALASASTEPVMLPSTSVVNTEAEKPLKEKATISPNATSTTADSTDSPTQRVAPATTRFDNPEVGKHVAANNLDAGGMLVSLLLVLALIIVAASVLKKFRMVPQLGQGMKVITSMHLGPKERIVVVEVNEKQLLLGVTAHNISILQQLETPLTPAQPIPTELATGLSKLLKR